MDRAGDLTAGDRIFSIRLSLTPPFPEVLEYRVSAALSGVLPRVTSDAFSIHAFAPKTAEQTLSLLSNELEKGALENVTRYFGPSAANQMIFSKLPEPVRLAMAAALRGATLTRDTGNVRYTASRGSTMARRCSLRSR